MLPRDGAGIGSFVKLIRIKQRATVIRIQHRSWLFVQTGGFHFLGAVRVFHVGQDAEMPVIGKLKTIFYCRMVLSVIVYIGVGNSASVETYQGTIRNYLLTEFG
jgi:hypothetical protein